MASRKRPFSESVIVPLRMGVQRVSYVLFILLSVGLLALSRAESTIIDRMTTSVLDVVSPVLNAVAKPISTVREAFTHIEHILVVFEENQRLRTENERLLRWQAAAWKLEQENAAFRSILKFNPDPRVGFVTARVIGESGGPFVKTRLLNAGLRLGIESGMAVITGDGLIGRIVNVGERASRVLLLTDLNSRIPVSVVGSRHRAILVGDNQSAPRIEFPLGSADRIKAGDRVITSGDGGMFPAGLIVGDVIAMDEGVLRVRLSADLNRLDVVRVTRYSMPLLDIATPEVR